MGQSKEQGPVDVITQLQTAGQGRGGRAACPSWSSLLQIQSGSAFLFTPVPRTVKQGRKTSRRDLEVGKANKIQ